MKLKSEIDGWIKTIDYNISAGIKRLKDEAESLNNSLELLEFYNHAKKIREAIDDLILEKSEFHDLIFIKEVLEKDE